MVFRLRWCLGVHCTLSETLAIRLVTMPGFRSSIRQVPEAPSSKLLWTAEPLHFSLTRVVKQNRLLSSEGHGCKKLRVAAVQRLVFSVGPLVVVPPFKIRVR